MRGNEGRHSQALEPGVARIGEPAPDFPSNLPMLNLARVTMTRTLVGMRLFAYIRSFCRIKSAHSILLVIQIF